MRLRVTLTKCTTITLTLINLLILYLLWTTQSANKIQYTQDLRVTTNVTTTAHDENELIISKNLMYKIIKKDITFMFRQYENYDNDLIASVASLRNMLPNSQIIILTDRFIYPVLKLNATIKIVKIMPSLENNYDQRNVISQVKTKYIMFLSDSLRFTSVQVFIKMIQQLQLKSTQIVSVNVARSKQCYNVNIDVKRWTLQFINQSRNICDYVESDKQMILVKKKLLHSLTDAFMQPFPSAFYIQTSYLKYKVTKWSSSMSSQNDILSFYRFSHNNMWPNIFYNITAGFDTVFRKKFSYLGSLGHLGDIRQFTHQNIKNG
uniref:Fukutin-related protein n=1 Tax=Cacopsylla melanoneura TaxID=428564 RepID=A0A8D8SMQ3_9HEMI